MKRRQVLGVLTAAAGSALLPGSLARAADDGSAQGSAVEKVAGK